MAARGGLEQARFPWGDELEPGGAHAMNVWQGTFPNHNTRRRRLARHLPGRRIRAQRPRPAEHLGQRLGMVRRPLRPPDAGDPRRLLPLPRLLLQPLPGRGAQLQHARTARPATWASGSPATPSPRSEISVPSPDKSPATLRRPIGSLQRAGVDDPDHDRRGGAPMAHPTFEDARRLSDWEPAAGSRLRLSRLRSRRPRRRLAHRAAQRARPAAGGGQGRRPRAPRRPPGGRQTDHRALSKTATTGRRRAATRASSRSPRRAAQNTGGGPARRPRRAPASSSASAPRWRRWSTSPAAASNAGSRSSRSSGSACCSSPKAN